MRITVMLIVMRKELFDIFSHGDAENAESWELRLCVSAALRENFAGNVDNEQLAISN